MPDLKIARSDAVRLPFSDKQFGLVIGSPPYLDARTYGIGAQRDLNAWVAWMLDVTAEALRVSRGLVIWVCAGVTRDRTYQPGPEALLADWVRRGGSAYRPVYWHRSGIPGSGGDEWFRGDVEYCLAFKRAGKLPWTDNTANGHAPVCPPGGRMGHRQSDGSRAWKTKKRKRSEQDEVQSYVPPEKANPGNLISIKVGGGSLGNPLAHENEAPYPVEVPAWFIASHCPPDGLVLDPFGGSGTTGQAAMETGRRFVITDLRQSQCVLSRKRLGTVTPALFA